MIKVVIQVAGAILRAIWVILHITSYISLRRGDGGAEQDAGGHSAERYGGNRTEYASFAADEEIFLLRYVRKFAVGDEAFSKWGNEGHFRRVREFIWDYREPRAANGGDPGEPGSRLEAIVNNAFWKFGYNESTNQFPKRYPALTAEEIDPNNANYKPYKTSTLIFPKTFKWFGVLNQASGDLTGNSGTDGGPGPNEVATYTRVYGFTFLATAKNNRPGHAFTACPFIKKIIFKYIIPG